MVKRMNNFTKTYTLVVLLAISAAMLSLKEATAGTVQENCVNAGNAAMKVAEFRDVGVPPKIVANQLIEAGLDIDTAVRMTVWVYSKQQADPAALGQWAYSFCMADAGEPV